MKNVILALWGPSAVGKTALLAQLYLQALHLPGDWKIYPTAESRPFIDRMRPLLVSNNFFPDATSVGTQERIVYRFRNHKTGAEAFLDVEDRAGRDSEDSNHLDKDGRNRLAEADGLVLLFDPTRNGIVLRDQVISTLEHLHAGDHTGGKDPRPIAVCLSKADLVVRTFEDDQRARLEPDPFVRERMVTDLAGWIDHYCANYRFFPVSAAGFRVRWGVVEPVVFFDERFQLRISEGGTPVHLIEPFLWIFEQLGEKS